MEGMLAAGHTKAIGVSNFTQPQLQHLISVSQVVPAVNQVEIHPCVEWCLLLLHLLLLLLYQTAAIRPLLVDDSSPDAMQSV